MADDDEWIAKALNDPSREARHLDGRALKQFRARDGDYRGFSCGGGGGGVATAASTTALGFLYFDNVLLRFLQFVAFDHSCGPNCYLRVR